jgi:hypothetical protein
MFRMDMFTLILAVYWKCRKGLQLRLWNPHNGHQILQILIRKMIMFEDVEGVGQKSGPCTATLLKEL